MQTLSARVCTSLAMIFIRKVEVSLGVVPNSGAGSKHVLFFLLTQGRYSGACMCVCTSGLGMYSRYTGMYTSSILYDRRCRVGAGAWVLWLCTEEVMISTVGRDC